MSTPNPYAPPLAEVSDEPFLEPAELAAPGTRLGAFLLDFLFAASMFLPSMIAVRLESLRGDDLAAEIGGLLSLIIWVTWMVWTLVLLHRSGQTLGKRVLRIRIVRRNGERASLPRLVLLRALPAIVMLFLPWIGPVLFLLDSAMVLSVSRRCLHDRTADTIVVRA